MPTQRKANAKTERPATNRRPDAFADGCPQMLDGSGRPWKALVDRERLRRALGGTAGRRPISMGESIFVGRPIAPPVCGHQAAQKQGHPGAPKRPGPMLAPARRVELRHRDRGLLRALEGRPCDER